MIKLSPSSHCISASSVLGNVATYPIEQGARTSKETKKIQKGPRLKDGLLMVSEQSQKAPALPASRRPGKGEFSFFSPGGTFCFE
ncbi:hypothetical protein CDAR_172221 [Caerostris darwini]|uniref:Uncharacterized protein n=1 Tax=Caerostris darwini TaxID=1538125 RepID=A0AAV4U3G7_9ARAC|nr:hypothetical protein CDAR_172221 [Caerostris darwini]